MDEDVERIRAHFDDFGAGEWDRLGDSARGRVAFEVHRRMLGEFVQAGDRVLEIGAGPGRFTIALGELGARVTVADISPVQLDLNARKVADAGFEHSVERRLVLDARNLGELADGSYDVCVAYGGLLSYVFEADALVLDGLLASVRNGGHVLGSVMATVGSVRYFLSDVRVLVDEFGRDHIDYEIRTGDLRRTPIPHTCRMYRWRELEVLFAAAPCRVVAVSASNCLSLGDAETVDMLEASPELCQWFVDWEVELCREPGAIESGTHIVFALERAS